LLGLIKEDEKFAAIASGTEAIPPQKNSIPEIPENLERKIVRREDHGSHHHKAHINSSVPINQPDQNINKDPVAQSIVQNNQPVEQ
ncbi:hypothetical protein OE165_27760, partial [Escherichia coli]|uniref:hypothetical protein n=1 Tax=Escherichia coli TaxID=562 RepID=UPI0021F366EB